MNRLVPLILAAVLLCALCGCEEDELTKTAREAAKQSADQQRQLAQMQAEVARGASQLVESDSKARTELAALQRDLQQDQAEIGRQRDQLEADRRQIAEQRHRDPLIAAAITSIGLILACLLPLLLCWALLRRPPLDGEAEAALAEFLVQDLMSDHPVLLPAHAPHALLEQPSADADGPQDGPEERQPVPDQPLRLFIPLSRRRGTVSCSPTRPPRRAASLPRRSPTMIATAKTMRQAAVRACTAKFMSLLPQIQEQARFGFRHEGAEQRDELIAEVVANCWVAFVRLVDRGLMDVAQATPLAQFAIKQVRDGRRVGAKLCVNDVSSGYAQRMKCFRVERLDHFNEEEGTWREVLIEDRHAGPSETAAARIDFAEWFDSLPKHKRRVAEILATSETTKTAARKFGSHLADSARTGNVVARVPG